MKFGVIIFPGSNCDHDAYWTIQQVAKQPVTFLWHDSHDLQNWQNRLLRRDNTDLNPVLFSRLRILR